MNRVYRIDLKDSHCYYVAKDKAAAAKAHAGRVGTKKLKNGQNPIEVPPDKFLTVGFDDCAEAIAHMIGANPAAIRPSLAGLPLADEYVAIQRAAQQWARTTPQGSSRFLWVVDSA